MHIEFNSTLCYFPDKIFCYFTRLTILWNFELPYVCLPGFAVQIYETRATCWLSSLTRFICEVGLLLCLRISGLSMSWCSLNQKVDSAQPHSESAGESYQPITLLGRFSCHVVLEINNGALFFFPAGKLADIGWTVGFSGCGKSWKIQLAQFQST